MRGPSLPATSQVTLWAPGTLCPGPAPGKWFIIKRKALGFLSLPPPLSRRQGKVERLEGISVGLTGGGMRRWGQRPWSREGLWAAAKCGLRRGFLKEKIAEPVGWLGEWWIGKGDVDKEWREGVNYEGPIHGKMSGVGCRAKRTGWPLVRARTFHLPWMKVGWRTWWWKDAAPRGVPPPQPHPLLHYCVTRAHRYPASVCWINEQASEWVNAWISDTVRGKYGGFSTFLPVLWSWLRLALAGVGSRPESIAKV